MEKVKTTSTLKDYIERFYCENCKKEVMSHWVEVIEKLILSQPYVFIGREAVAKRFAEEYPEVDKYCLSKMSSHDLFVVFYDSKLKPIYLPREGGKDKLDMDIDLGVELMKINDTLETREDFFNYEADRVDELSEDDLVERIKKYGDILFSARTFQNACMLKLKEIVAESRKDFDLEALKPEKKAATRARSTSKVDPLTAAARNLMKLMPNQLTTIEEAIAFIQKQKGGGENETTP